RFIADSWFSDDPLPRAYTHTSAAQLRKSGGVSSKPLDAAALDAYLAAVDVRGAITAVADGGRALGGRRGAYLVGLAGALGVMWERALEVAGRGRAVPYERSVRAVTGSAPEPSDPTPRRERVAALLARAGHPTDGPDALLGAVDAWRRERLVPRRSLRALGNAIIAELDALAVRNLLPYLPDELKGTPRANVTFLPSADAWFSGSMSYLGRARRPDGAPECEATYELNASLEISVPELQQLVSHEVVPGHVTTFACLQRLYTLGRVGFEATILTMSTSGAALFEGIAQTAILIAHGVREVEQLPDEDLQRGVLLSLLQDAAKNQASYLLWNERRPAAEVGPVLRRDFLVSEERAGKLSGGWGHHPILGRMYLPAYRHGTELVARLRRTHPANRVLPALFGARGLVDTASVEGAIAGP